MKRFNLHHLGRFGNQLFGYAFARGYCEKYGLELHTDPWIGEEIFEINHPRCTEALPRMDEFSIEDEMADISYRSYSQCQKCANYYSRAKCKEWFRFRPEIKAKLDDLPNFGDSIVGHVRHGDFKGYNYALVSLASYDRKAHEIIQEMGLAGARLSFVSEEYPLRSAAFDGELSFLPDFYRLMRAPILLRANSSFSFWSAVLGDNDLVYSPIIDGLTGGVEHDVKWVEGNWPRLSHHHFVTDIHIS